MTRGRTLGDPRQPILPATFRARWLFPVDAPPIPNALIEIDAAGRIAAISSGTDRGAIDLGHVAIVPSLVNAHLHLEFSDLNAPIAPPLPFSTWIGNVLAHRRAREIPIAEVIRRGLSESRDFGSLALGEIATCDAQVYERITEGISLVLFRELIGPLATNWPEQLALAEAHLASCRQMPGIIGGLSPHAPYTVPQELFERIIALAERNQAPVTVHLAETASERSLLAERKGELVEMLRRFDLWDDSWHPSGRSFSDWIIPLARASRGLIIHGNYLDDVELDLIATHENLTLVYCPRTHAYFGHPSHPFIQLLQRGGRVALGTDGRSSNPDLSLWAEANFIARRHPELSSDRILEMVTRAAAEALGIADYAGTLAVGRQANFLAVDIDEIAGRPVLFQSGRPPSRVFYRGLEIHCEESGEE